MTNPPAVQEANPSRRFANTVWLAFFLGAIIGWWTLSGDWCFAWVKILFVGGIALWIVNRVFWHNSPELGRRGLRLLIAVGLGIGAAAIFPLDRDWAFDCAFGTKAPTNLKHLKMSRFYEGGPGEHSIIFEFDASAADIKELTHARKEAADGHAWQRWNEQGRVWAAIPESFAGPISLPLSTRKWNSIPPLHNPRVWFWRDGVFATVLVWDESTGRTAAFHSRG